MVAHADRERPIRSLPGRDHADALLHAAIDMKKSATKLVEELIKAFLAKHQRGEGEASRPTVRPWGDSGPGTVSGCWTTQSEGAVCGSRAGPGTSRRRSPPPSA